VAPDIRDDRKQQIKYAVDRLPAGDRIVRSVGLEAIGQRDIGARVPAGLPHDADHQAMSVLQFIAAYVIDSGARILAGQTFAYGWTMLRFNDSRPSILEIEEDTDPLSPDHPAHWAPGVQRAIALRLAGEAVMRRNRLAGQADYPNRGHFALACVHVTDDSTGRLVAERGPIDDQHPLGARVGNCIAVAAIIPSINGTVTTSLTWCTRDRSSFRTCVCRKARWSRSRSIARSFGRPAPTLVRPILKIRTCGASPEAQGSLESRLERGSSNAGT